MSAVCRSFRISGCCCCFAATMMSNSKWRRRRRLRISCLQCRATAHLYARTPASEWLSSTTILSPAQVGTDCPTNCRSSIHFELGDFRDFFRRSLGQNVHIYAYIAWNYHWHWSEVCLCYCYLYFMFILCLRPKPTTASAVHSTWSHRALYFG